MSNLGKIIINMVDRLYLLHVLFDRLGVYFHHLDLLLEPGLVACDTVTDDLGEEHADDVLVCDWVLPQQLLELIKVDSDHPKVPFSRNPIREKRLLFLESGQERRQYLNLIL